MHYISYVQNGISKEEYLDLYYTQKDLKRYAYLLSLYEYKHIRDLYVEFIGNK
jgi:hypothetical protein